MSDLTLSEKRKLEKLLDMGGGYVLNFSNRTLDEFVIESVGRSIYDQRYSHGSGSKANQIRGFWKAESNPIVGKLMEDLLDYAVEIGWVIKGTQWYKELRQITERLSQSGPVIEMDAFAALTDERDFETVAKAVREAIEKDEPASGIDRLHTFVIKYVRTLCTKHGLTVTREKPLHSLFGEYVKCLRAGKYVETEMAFRILKSSISILEAFNDVRNNRSLAHDNTILDYDEALLIFNQVASSIRFLRSVENRLERLEQQAPAARNADDIPF